MVSIYLNCAMCVADWKFADCPGKDRKNYKGDEIALMMYGLMPLDVDFKVYIFSPLLWLIYT